MIKFWKSADKGKTGCPVRPPELHSVNNMEIKTLQELQPKSYDEGSQIYTLKKKSKLSLYLHDILVRKIALKYFISFMETLGQQLMIKCWLELENFKTLVNNGADCNFENKTKESKIFRAKSFELNSDSIKLKNKDLKSLTNMFKTESCNINEFATSSCVDLVEHTKIPNEYENNLIHKNDDIITERALNLFKKYVALEAPYQLDLTDNIRKSIITNICQPEGVINETCFQPVQDLIFNQINEKYFNDFLNSPLYIKAQIDILTNENLNVEDVIYNDTLLFYFTEYLEQESSRVLLEFFMAVIHFQESFENTKPEPDQVQSDAIILYDKYFSLQATSPVGFPTEIRLQVESDICREEGPLSTCFDVPLNIVLKTLSSYVKTFLESDLYYKYLSEMIHSVNQMSPNHKSHSDCSSEYSISTQNTLLAMGDPIFSKKKRNHSVPDMTIDSNQLYNADALWQRKRHDGLILGRVNSLGRFESKFEPDPDTKHKSVLKKMVSKFVPTGPSKVEEEMAWQIAHMIVKDVTDLTMAPPDNDRDVL